MSSQIETPEEVLAAKLNEFLTAAGEIHGLLGQLLPCGNLAAQYSERITAVRTKAEELQKIVGSKKSFNYTNLVSIVLAVLAFVLSFVSFGFTFLWLKPDVHLSGGPTLNISYIPTSKTLSLNWKLVVANYGRKMDIITWTKGELISPDLRGSTGISLPQSHFVLRTSGGPVSTPFVAKENSAIEIDATASTQLGTDTFVGLFGNTENQMERRELLKVSFERSDRKLSSVDLCFNLATTDLGALEKGDALITDITECNGMQ